MKGKKNEKTKKQTDKQERNSQQWYHIYPDRRSSYDCFNDSFDLMEILIKEEKKNGNKERTMQKKGIERCENLCQSD